MHWVEWGERGPYPVILIHGFRDHCRTWDFLVAELLAILPDLWLVAPDCRGHGDSGWVGAGGYYHFFDYLMDLDSLVGHLGVPNVRLVGHSMGGTIACLYAGTHPERISKLALVEGLGPPDMSFADAPRRAARWLDEVPAVREGPGYASLEEAADRLRRAYPRLTAERARHLACHGMHRTEAGAWQWKFDPLHRTTSPQPFYLEQFREFLRHVTCPTLVVQGAESEHRARGDIQARYGWLPRADLVILHGAGHMVQQDNPEALARTLAPFLA
ncbi:MAG: alpha/beta hydrolase [Deltaproteobacteria bacterium]|nr:alpha/beta hydrolase [Deltaproteobacteria bacterium]